LPKVVTRQRRGWELNSQPAHHNGRAHCYNHHSSDNVYWRRGDSETKNVILYIILIHHIAWIKLPRNQQNWTLTMLKWN